MNYKLYYFTFFDKSTKKIENLEVKAQSFAEAMPTANIFRHTLGSVTSKSNWDVVSVKDMSFAENISD
tara:strand:+ start:105 stop:308 length:204 start_codon:yes stop_codon:yes gene_type:complete